MKLLLNTALACALAVSALASVHAGEPVDINTADAVTLADAMPGVGLKRAKAIVEYRRQHGPFDRLDDLTEVYGIGEKLLDKSRDRLMVR